MTDRTEVEAAARDYVEGWYSGDVERMDRALHPDLMKRILVHDEETGSQVLRAVTKERMVELTASGGGESPDPDYEIWVDEVSELIASARVLSPEYLDFLHLQNTREGWKIVNVLFRTHE